jgi:membrane associated rhomboid family serine protease
MPAADYLRAMSFPAPPPQRQPIFNMPPAITGLLGLLVAVCAAQTWWPAANEWLVLNLAFIPARFTQPDSGLFGGQAGVWTFVTYAFLHGGWIHLATNGLWLAAFGSPLARRFGTGRFLLFSAVGAVGGAIAHFAAFFGDVTPMVGASAAISAHMAGVSRFAFQPGGALSGRRFGRPDDLVPALSIMAMLRERRVLTFLGVWFGINLLFGVFGGAAFGAPGAVAWQAHIGGFAAGLLLFPLFDPPRRLTAPRPFDEWPAA